MLGTLPQKRFFAPALAGLGLLVFGSLFAVRIWLYQPFDIPSSSMEPSLNLRDHFLVQKFAYSNTDPKRGDIVVFFLPSRGVNFVKRIVGVPGDHIQMKQDRLFINGTMVPERRIGDWTGDCTSQPCPVPQYEEALPGGRKIRVLDQFPDGPLDDTQMWVVPAGSYFVMGDNRDNSDDSRADQGFVPRDQIVGRVAYRYLAGGKPVWQTVN